MVGIKCLCIEILGAWKMRRLSYKIYVIIPAAFIFLHVVCAFFSEVCESIQYIATCIA